MNCIFCDYLRREKYIMENELAFAMYDNFPVNKGHMLVMPKRHYASYFDSTPEEIAAFNELIKRIKALLDFELKPDGYNIGINIGDAAGQTIFHLHIHIIPRYKGDVPNPRGGVRNLKQPLVEYDG
jgi:diadenosine tetraphosphate (Ap4A) HIT family hydrolase